MKLLSFTVLVLLGSARGVFAVPMEQMVKDESYILLPQQKGWHLDRKDSVCVVHREREIACGPIRFYNKKKAIARIDSHLERIWIGDEVRPATAAVPAAEPAPAASTPLTQSTPPPTTERQVTSLPHEPQLRIFSNLEDDAGVRLSLIQYHRARIHELPPIPEPDPTLINAD